MSQKNKKNNQKDNFFQKIPSKFNFVANEKRLLNWWYDQGVVDEYLHKNDDADKKFSFLDGPITANNPMGVHHAWGRTLKDLYQRYKNMQGFKQRFQNGFDCQGLWVEVEVEKEKGFETKKDIEDYGLAEFIKDCKARVRKYSDVQTDQSKRLGYFMDWDNSYFTMSEENNYTIWHFLKTCHQDGNIYKGEDVVPWCPRCGTAISHQEVAEGGYHKLTHQSVYMRFPVIKDNELKENEFLLVWTTTPWTIPADTLVAVSPEINYALVEHQGKKYWLAKKLVKATFGKELEPLKTLNGKQLIEQEKISHYQAPFDHLPVIEKLKENNPEKFHAVVLSEELVNQEEGTGLVHIVPGTGEEDYDLVKEDLKWDEVIFPAVDEAGKYLKGFGNLTGKNAKTTPKLIFDQLRKIENGYYLFDLRSYTHPYPKCWRCKSELMWRLVEEWYIDMDNPRGKDNKTYRQRMMDVTKKINWTPDFGEARELDWLKNMQDWMISKKRYWGLALPIWECKQCGNFEVIGSKEELKQRAVDGWEEFDGHTPHRPWIDNVKIKCSECGETVTRIPDVGNPWLDAGIVSFSTITPKDSDQVSYLSDQKFWKKWYPADFVTECFPGQFRNWFYALIAMSTVLEDHEPFKNLLGHALVRDENGEEMHKSTGNAIWFDDAAEEMGVDVMRWLYARQDPEFNVNFGYNIADEVRRQYIFLLWNSYRFFVTYANLNNWQPKEKSLDNLTKLDQWILSRLKSTHQKTTKELDSFHHHQALQAIEQLLKDLSLWYIRRSRKRVSPQNEDEKDRQACLSTMYHVIRQTTLILAPFIPYLSETLWQALHGHLEEWDKNNSVHLQDWPEIKDKWQEKKLEKKMAAIREAVSLGHSIRKQQGISLRQPLQKFSISNFQFTELDEELIDLIKKELNVKQVELASGPDEVEVDLNTKVTPKLKAEGEARNLIRKIQRKRRKADLTLEDRIIVYAPEWPKEFEDRILKRTRAKEIKQADELKVKKV
jgi:isoleucyl-tRNA synthetase